MAQTGGNELEAVRLCTVSIACATLQPCTCAACAARRPAGTPSCRTPAPLPATQVKNYFNTSGYERWKKIYGETDDVNKVQLDIRKGHAQTVEKVLKWVDEEGGVEGVTVCDAGCGTGGVGQQCAGATHAGAARAAPKGGSTASSSRARAHVYTPAPAPLVCAPRPQAAWPSRWPCAALP